MGAPVGNKFAKGNKGGGRKSARVELSKDAALRKAWIKVSAELDSKDVTAVALPLALKDMVEKKNVSGQIINLHFDSAFDSNESSS